MNRGQGRKTVSWKSPAIIQQAGDETMEVKTGLRSSMFSTAPFSAPGVSLGLSLGKEKSSPVSGMTGISPGLAPGVSGSLWATECPSLS